MVRMSRRRHAERSFSSRDPAVPVYTRPHMQEIEWKSVPTDEDPFKPVHDMHCIPACQPQFASGCGVWRMSEGSHQTAYEQLARHLSFTTT